MAAPTDPDELTVLINGAEFKSWETIDITSALDAYSTLELDAPFEPANKAFREAFRPFTFKPLEVKIGGEQRFTGTLVAVQPDHDANRTFVHVSGYALPGVLDNCCAPANTLPIEFKKLGLQQIMGRVASPFGIGVVFQALEGARFDKVKLDVDKDIYEFLIELAQQRNLVISSTPKGELLCWRSTSAGHPVARLAAGMPPVSAVRAAFEPLEYYSEVTGFARSRKRKKGSRYTEQNPYLRDVLRPKSFRLSDTEKGDAPEETRAKLGRMFGNMAAFEVDVTTWRDPAGELWQENTTVLLTAPEVMVYRETELVIRAVTLHDDKDSKWATLELALIGAFSGEIPKELPWQE